MSELKTLKEMNLEDAGDIHFLKEEAIKWVKEIQNGRMPSREFFPEDMKGTYAKNYWNNGRFTLGMEYGAILILLKFFNLTEKDLEE